MDLIDKTNSMLSIRRQCKLIDLHKSNLYYEPVIVSEQTMREMNRIDELYTKYPFYGSRRIAVTLKAEGWSIGRKRVQSLMRKMGITAIYPKPKLSKGNAQHIIYPYLLSNIKIIRPNQVWSSDITYIRLRQGFLYLVAIIDWFSRYVLSWKLSTSLESGFCIEALKEALETESPEIFNSDQGSQFTSNDFTAILKEKEIKISMDGRGRALDNVFVERLWRSVKYEEVYIKAYQEVIDAKKGLEWYFPFYNKERRHQSLGYKTPNEVHYNFLAKKGD
jgi:putative transposase